MKEAFGATSALRWLVFALTAGVVYACWPLWPVWGALLGPLIVRLWIEALALQTRVEPTQPAR